MDKIKRVIMYIISSLNHGETQVDQLNRSYRRFNP